MNLDRIAPLAAPAIRILPVLHDRVDLAGLVAGVLDRLRPAAVAVELPTTIADAVDRAVARLPEISAVISEEPGDDPLVWFATPGDPTVEALRWAAEHRRPRFFIDPDVRYRGRHHEAFPDPHAMHTLGPAAYLEIVRRLARNGRRGDADLLRERGMAYHLLEAAAQSDGVILAVVGAAHADSLAHELSRPTAPPLARQHRASVIIRNLHPEDLAGVLRDPPLAHAVSELLRRPERLPDQAFADTLSRRIDLVADGLRIVSGAAADDDRNRDQAVVRWVARRARRCTDDGRVVLDRAALGHALWHIASASWENQTRSTVQPWQRKLFFDFCRRHARVQGMLVPGIFEWVVAGRGVADDNLAWELFSAARAYPWQRESAAIETARIDGDVLDLGTRRVRFRRRFFRIKRRLVPVRSRPAPRDPAEWIEAFDAAGICSYPPEDLVVEDYGRFLKSKAMSILSAESTRSEPFSTSMLDGIDLRETLMRWHEGRIWVRELGRAPGRAGAVVAIFDDDRDGSGYPYLLSWLGEHDQESDMAFYATDPTRQIVGPGIMRATYGGFMLSYPPGRLFDVWRDRDYADARSKPEVLTMAAVDYSTEKLVVHLAPTPPSERMRSFAAARGKRIVHIPLGSISPITIRKIRVVHILAGRDKRAIAKDYIW